MVVQVILPRYFKIYDQFSVEIFSVLIMESSFMEFHITDSECAWDYINKSFSIHFDKKVFHPFDECSQPYTSMESL